MPFAVFCWHEDLSRGCPEEGNYPDGPSFTMASDVFDTMEAARTVAVIAAADRTQYDRSVYAVLEVFVSEPLTVEEAREKWEREHPEFVAKLKAENEKRERTRAKRRANLLKNLAKKEQGERRDR